MQFANFGIFLIELADAQQRRGRHIWGRPHGEHTEVHAHFKILLTDVLGASLNKIRLVPVLVHCMIMARSGSQGHQIGNTRTNLA